MTPPRYTPDNLGVTKVSTHNGSDSCYCTAPKSVCDFLGVEAGSRVVWREDGDRVVVEPYGE